MRVSAGCAEMGLSGKIRMKMRPSPWRKCVAATRPASICWALSQPFCMLWRPYSPKTTKLPRVASPRILPLCCFRCLTLLGMSAMAYPSVAADLVGSPVEPALHPDHPEVGKGLGESVLDVGVEGPQGDLPFREALAAGHLGPAQAAGHLQANALGALVAGRLDGRLHDA